MTPDTKTADLPELTSEEIAEIEKEAEAKFPTPPQAVHGAHYATRTKHKRDGFIAGATLERRRAKADKEGATAECLRSKERIAAVPYQLCPKCHGQGIVGFPPYAIPGVPALSSETQWTCDVCNGSKIIPQFIPDPPKE